MQKLISRFMLLLIILSATALPFQAQMMDDEASYGQTLGATNMDGVPEGVAAEDWLGATGFATSDGSTVTVSASGLVPNGLYTLWWVNPMPEMSMGPGGGAEANEFTADENGDAETTIEVMMDHDYQTLVVAYHADDMTHGDSPGEMGVVTFSQLIGGFPGSASMPMSATTALTPVDMDGTPEDVDAEAWLSAEASATMAMGMNGEDTVVVEATGLVPDGVYTLWWVNNMMDMDNMSMGPAGGTPSNEFTADSDGNGFTFINVPSENDYQTLVLAYHADDMTHGDSPGEMGVVTFSHLMGAFPGPGGTMGGMATALSSTDMDGVPEGIEAESWLSADAAASMSMAMDGTDTVLVELSGLVPDGVYTLWWVNNMMDMDNMSMGPVGGPEDNAFTADSDGYAEITVTVPSDNDYQTLVIAYHADGNTYGDSPGEMGVITFSQLMGEFPGPANSMMDDDGM